MLIFFLCLYAYCTVLAVLLASTLESTYRPHPLSFLEMMFSAAIVFCTWPFFVKRIYKDWQTAKNTL